MFYWLNTISMKLHFLYSFLAYCLFFSVLFFGGCSKDEGRSDITGQVTIDGVPAKRGLVEFMPEKYDPSISCEARVQIADGKYLIEDGLGLLPGKYIVRVTSQKIIDNATKRELDIMPDDPFSFTLEEIVPEKYNKKSDLRFDVEDKKGPKAFDIAISTK